MSLADITRTCPGCGATFIPTNGRQGFCTPAHQIDFHILSAARGKTLLPLLLTWRAGKKRKSPEARYAFDQLCAALDGYIREDRAANRHPEILVRRKLAAGWTAADTLNRRVGARD